MFHISDQFCFLNGGAHIVELIVTGVELFTLFTAEQEGSKDKCACVFAYRYVCMCDIFVYT